MRAHRLIILLVIVSLTGCKTTQTTQAVARATYSEDLSVHRPNFGTTTSTSTDQVIKSTISNSTSPEAVLPQGHIKMELDSISKLISLENAKPRIEQGYTILLYNGSDREQARNFLGKIRVKFPDIKARMEYYQPDFKVKVGKFTDRVIAYETYEQVRREFRGALLIPEKIRINYD